MKDFTIEGTMEMKTNTLFCRSAVMLCHSVVGEMIERTHVPHGRLRVGEPGLTESLGTNGVPLRQPPVGELWKSLQ